jgi:hypothetical protein
MPQSRTAMKAAKQSTRARLEIGFRVSLVATGLTIALGVRAWYGWIPLGVMAVLLLADLTLRYKERRSPSKRQ